MACDEYLPVPMIRRDVNVRPAITNGESANQSSQLPASTPGRLSASDEIDDLHLVAVADHHLWEPVPFDDGQVVLDGNTARVDVELFQQRNH